MKESEKIREILSSLPANKRLFRINAGMGWTGEVRSKSGDLVVLERARPLHAAPRGWPDLAGWEEIEITEDLVGSRIAVFVGEEVKLRGKLSREQRLFGELLERMGGRFRVIRD